MQDNPLVYSTETGRVAPTKSSTQSTSGDGIVRIRRETKGRKGKGVTVVTGLPLTQEESKKLCSNLKKLCGTGGSTKADSIEIQGDNRDKIKAHLEQQGFTVKLSGG